MSEPLLRSELLELKRHEWWTVVGLENAGHAKSLEDLLEVFVYHLEAGR
jgi:hypothetical protein